MGRCVLIHPNDGTLGTLGTARVRTHDLPFPSELVREAYLVRLPAVDGALARAHVGDVLVLLAAKCEPAGARVRGTGVAIHRRESLLAAHALARVQRGHRFGADRVYQPITRAGVHVNFTRLYSFRVDGAECQDGPLRLSHPRPRVPFRLFPRHRHHTLRDRTSRRAVHAVRHTLQLREVTVRDQRQDVNVVVSVVHRDDPVGKVHRRVGNR